MVVAAPSFGVRVVATWRDHAVIESMDRTHDTDRQTEEGGREGGREGGERGGRESERERTLLLFVKCHGDSMCTNII